MNSIYYDQFPFVFPLAGHLPMDIIAHEILDFLVAIDEEAAKRERVKTFVEDNVKRYLRGQRLLAECPELLPCQMQCLLYQNKELTAVIHSPNIPARTHVYLPIGYATEYEEICGDAEYNLGGEIVDRK